MQKILFLPVVFLFSTSFMVKAEESLSVKISNIRHAYYRTEDVRFEAVIGNPGSLPVKNVIITIGLPPLGSVKKIINLDRGETISVHYDVRCSSLRPGAYKLKITSGWNGRSEEKLFDVFISQPPNPQRLSVDYWVPLNYWVPESESRLTGSLKLLEWGMAHGFNTFKVVFSTTPPVEDREAAIETMRNLFEKAIRERVNMGFEFVSTRSSLFSDHPEVFVRQRGAKGAMTQDNQRENDVCLREPHVIETAEKMIREDMKIFNIYPSYYHILINSEFQSSPCYSDDCIKRLKAETGLDLYNYNVNPLRPPKTEEEARKAALPVKLIKAVPVKGIIENENPWYHYYMWWWKRGMGDALLNEAVSDIVKEYKPDVITWHDPFRLAPVYGTHRGLDCIGHWNYAHPDPKYAGYVETLITGAFPERQMVMPDVTTWEYQNWLAPSDSGIIIMPPDILRENLWIALSRRPDFLCHYNSTSLNPMRNVDPWHRDPKTFEMMTWMSENVYKPYGPFILQMERTSRKAAILSSASSVLFPEISRGGYPNTAIYPFYSLLMMAHIPTDVIFDETITRYGLNKYNILFLHQCETLTRDVYEKILEFKSRGGIVIGDKFLRADIPLDHRCEFDLDHRKRQLADLVLKGKGVTADEDRELMIRYTDEIRKVLDGKAYRLVDSDSPEVIFNVLQSGPVKYIFMVNDKRTYGEKYGQRWKTFHEKGLEQLVSVRLMEEGKKEPVLYDIREHKRVPVEKNGNIFSFTRKLGPCDGTIIAVYPDPVINVRVECPEIIRKEDEGMINISVTDSEGKRYGTQPVKVTVTDPAGNLTAYSDYYATTNGTFRFGVIPAKNDLSGNWKVSVTDLTSGIESSSNFIVE
jgi:hypothetical protein